MNDRPNPLLARAMAEMEAREAAGEGEQPGYDHAQKQPLSALAYGHWSHKKLAAQVRMLMRDDLQHEAIVCAARDRIAWLAKRVEDLEAIPNEAEDLKRKLSRALTSLRTYDKPLADHIERKG